MQTIINEKNKKVEKRFLAYLFNNKKYIAESLGTITESHLFYYDKLYGLLCSYFSDNQDILTDNMAEILFEKNNIDSQTIVQYKSLISELRAQINFNDGEFKALINEIIENKKRYEILNMAEIIVNSNPIECNSQQFVNLENSIKNKFSKLESINNDIRKEGSLKNSIKERMRRYLDIKNNPDQLKFVPTGFRHIDGPNGGFRPGELVYVIGRKADGKSTLLLNLAHNAWENGKNVIIFSLEISKEDYERRFDARAALVTSNGLKMGKLSEDEFKKYQDYLLKLEQGKSINNKDIGTLYIVDTSPGITPAFVRSKTDSIEQVLGIKFDVIITDYAGIMNPTIFVPEKRHQQGQIALDQKVIAREKQCVVISAAQKSRAGSKEKDADSAYIAESDQVADHLDWGIDIMSTGKDYGVIQSFKTRDAEEFKFSFKKKYDMFYIQELEKGIDAWDQLT